jgi:low temperature requirement protein LtrA
MSAKRLSAALRRPPKLWCLTDEDTAIPDAPRRVTWSELFFDLVFVALVAQVGTPLATDYSFHALTRYALLLLVIWWAWNGYAVYATRFDSDDTLQRVMTFVQMIAVIFMAANAEDALDSVSSAGFAAAYALMRAVLVLQYVRASRIPAARRLAREYAVGFGIAAAIWLASSLTPVPVRYGLWTIALAIDLGTALVTARHTRHLPPHAEHLPERFGLFTLILLGESIVAIMKGIQAQPDWTPSAAGSALVGIGLIFTCWWAYFDWAQAATTRRISTAGDARRFEVWNYAHLPLYLGLALTAVGVEHIVQLGAVGFLHAEEVLLLASAIGTVVMSLVVLARSRGRRTSACGI